VTDVTPDILAERLAGLAALVDRRFIESDRAVTAALAAAEKATDKAFLAAAEAVNKAEQAQLRVNATQNEFRGTLADQNATTERTMMPRAETELLMREMNAKMDDLRRSRDAATGRQSGVAVSASVLVAIVGVAATIVTVAVVLVGVLK
jgi:hypothetical protein